MEIEGLLLEYLALLGKRTFQAFLSTRILCEGVKYKQINPSHVPTRLIIMLLMVKLKFEIRMRN